MSWLERIFRRRRLYDELAEEVREHIEEKTEQLMRLENLSRAEARHAALRAFGNPTLVETRSREVWQWSRLESFLTDLKFAFRRLTRSPGFATNGAFHAGHRHRRQHGSFYRGRQYSAQAAALSPAGTTGGGVAARSWSKRLGQFRRRVTPFAVDVFDLRRT